MEALCSCRTFAFAALDGEIEMTWNDSKVSVEFVGQKM